MILLSPSALAAHPFFSRMSNPPTHAKIINRVISAAMGVTLQAGHAAIPPNDQIVVLYAYGSLAADGTFVPDQSGETVHSMLDLSLVDPPEGAPDYAEKMQRRQAAANVRNAGVAPNPLAPHEALVVPSKEYDDFKMRDLDAFFAYHEPMLNGTVVTT